MSVWASEGQAAAEEKSDKEPLNKVQMVSAEEGGGHWWRERERTVEREGGVEGERERE